MTAVYGGIYHIRNLCIYADSHNIHPVGHDIADMSVIKLEYAAYHVTFIRLNGAVLAALIKHHQYLFLCYSLLLGEKEPAKGKRKGQEQYPHTFDDTCARAGELYGIIPAHLS